MKKTERNQKQNYQLLKKIGTGSYGKVFKAQTKNDKRVVAIKVIDIKNRDKADIEQVLNEIRILFSINSPYIIDYYTAFINDSSTEFWIVMEYMPGGDLQKKIQKAKKQRQRISEKEIWKYFVQILAGIRDLNLKNIIHRDIKPANIFLSKDFKLCKIGDMNVSKVIKDQLAQTQIGTPYYLPPEIWKNESYDIKCDIFSLGCLIYELATLKHPFEANSTNELQKKVLKRKTPDLPVFYSQELNLIVKKCLSKTPSNRPTAEELYENSLFRKKVTEYGFAKFLDDNGEFCYAEILETIVIPKKLTDLNNLLPKKNLHQKSNSMVVLSNIDKQQYNQNICSVQHQDKQLKVQQIQKQNSVVCLDDSIQFQKPLIPQQNDKYIDIMKRNQSDIIKKFQKDQQNSQRNLKQQGYSNQNINPKPKMNFNKKRKPSQNFIKQNRKSVKQLSRKSSYSRYQKNLIDKQQQQKRLSSVKRQQSRQNSIKKERQSSRKNSIKIKTNSSRQNSINKDKQTERQKSIKKEIQLNKQNLMQNDNKYQSKKVPPPIKRKSNVNHKRLASLEGYYSNKEAKKQYQQQKQVYASYKKPPVRSQRQMNGKVLPPQKKKKRLRSKSQQNINSRNTTQEKKNKQKAMKYGDYMKKIAQEQRMKMKSRRSISKNKRKKSSSVNPKI